MFQKASRQDRKIKLAISGVAGSGKTYTALNIATNLELPVAVIDTENGSANIYSELFQFDICILDNYSPKKYIEAINYAVKAGYKTLCIDGLSAAWYWELEEVDKSKTSMLGWSKVRPLERELIQSIQKANIHIIATMRSKTEYAMEKSSNGKTVPRKVGTTPVQTSSIDYEFDIFGELNSEHQITFSKSRCHDLADQTFSQPGKQIADILKHWTSIKSTQAVNIISNYQPKITTEKLDNRQQIKERKVTNSQLKRLYAIANEARLSNEEAKAVIVNFGYASSKDILMTKYDEVVQAIKTAKVNS